MATNGLRHVLDGYKVLDFTQVLAGPTVTRLMAEMGAEIIKVELAPAGDFSRGFPYLRDGRSAYYIQQNRGKKSLCIDVKKPEGHAIVEELVKKVDVVVENYAPGVIMRMGFDYDSVRKLNPRIIMCSVSAFGQTGPLSSEPGYDYIAQAYAAVTYMIGNPNEAPSLPMLGLGDVSTGAHAMGAVVAALLHRERTGEGQYLDISILDTYFHCHEMNVQIYSATNGATNPKRSGVHHPQICPTGVFRSKEGYLIIMAFLDHQWAALCTTMGRPELINDPRYNTNALRLEHRDEVVNAIETWLAGTAGDAAAMEALRKARIPVAPVLSIDQAVNHPHLRARQTVRKISDPVFGEFDAPGFPLRFSAFPGFLPLTAPTLGQHNREILESYLGYSPKRIASLEQSGILQSGKR
jgi:crotonobetainyl-CoA:carnitine CoA-transferase CaiB-like acyl-CoA transferase